MQYLISGVRQSGNYIQYVRAGYVNNDKTRVEAVSIYPRSDVLVWLQAGHEVNTSVVYKDEGGVERWPTNAKVIPDGNFITTVRNNSTRDNLGNLPPC